MSGFKTIVQSALRHRYNMLKQYAGPITPAVADKQTSTDENEVEAVVPQMTEEPREDAAKIRSSRWPERSYLMSVLWWFVYMCYGFFGGYILNLITKPRILLRYDMVFNVFVSPVLYYQAPRRILTNIRFRDFVFFYTIPFIIGLCFRFLDDIPVLATFVLDPERITTEPQKIMFGCLAAGIVIGVLYYIFVSLNPWTNLIIFSVAVAFIAGTTYTFFIRGMDIHVHHYFLGLIMMVVSSNYHSKLIIIIHAIGYALYIEGLSRWGIGPNYYY